MKIISIDVGKKGAIVVYDYHSREYLDKIIYSFDGSFVKVYDDLEKIMEAYAGDAIICVIGEAFGQRVVVKKHSKFYGVIELLCERKGYALYYFSDNTCRATVLGKGNGRDKAAVHRKFQGETEDISDAMLFTAYLATQLEDLTPTK